MPAYVLVQVSIHDPEGYESYKQLTPDIIAHYGGRFIVRGGDVEVLEGEMPFQRLVILEFDTMEQARRWCESPEYSEARVLREAAATGLVMLADGINLQ